MRVKIEMGVGVGWGTGNPRGTRGTFTLLGRNPDKISKWNGIELKIVAECGIEKACFGQENS